MSITRRETLWIATELALAAAALFAGAGCRASDPCVDEGMLTTGQASLRESLHYGAHSPHGQAKQCAGCQFFSVRSGDANGCGTCQILQGPVHAGGHCDSWSARA